VEHSAAGVDSGCCKGERVVHKRRTVKVRKVFLIVNPFGGKRRIVRRPHAPNLG
jgi:hypothetical protein